MTEEQISTEKNSAIFNLSMGVINLIQSHFIKYAEYYTEQTWESCFTELDLAYQAISPILDTNEESASEQMYTKIQKEIASLGSQMNNAPRGKQVTVESDLPLKIRKFSILLRKQAHKHDLYILTKPDYKFLSMRE